MEIDFSDLIKKRKPTRKEMALFRRWIKYLKNSRLSMNQVYTRAKWYTSSKQKVPNE